VLIHTAFNLLNDIDLPKTEARIAEFAKQNAALIQTNLKKLEIEAMSQRERDDVERRAKQEKIEMLEEGERVEKEEEERVKREVLNALVCCFVARKSG
jgi:CDK-activating kinase assembly factor MAT1